MAERPYVFVNMAMTADGKIDTVERQGARISGPADSARVDRLRADADAVMVGGRTLASEDPRLTVRDPGLVTERLAAGRSPQPMKVGVSSEVRPDEVEALVARGAFLHDGGAPVVLCTTPRTGEASVDLLRREGVEVLVSGGGRVDLGHCLATVRELGVERLMVEGGSTLLAALLAAELVDEIQLAIAPLLFGGESAPTPVGGAGWRRPDAPELHLAETSTSADGDVVLRYLTRAGKSA